MKLLQVFLRELKSIKKSIGNLILLSDIPMLYIFV